MARLPLPDRRPHRWVIVPVLVAVSLVCGACTTPSFWAFHGATTQGHDIFKLWVGSMITGLIVAAIVYGLIIWSVIAYRKRRGDDSLPRQFHSNFVVEAIYTTVPILIVAGLFLFTVLTENNVDALNRPNEVVTATAFRWGWQFSYADASGRSQGVVVRTGAISGEVPTSALASPYPQIELPLGETVQIVLLSTDVVHALYIPEFEFGRQAVPGIRNVFDFTPTELGRFRGECVQYCGLYHDQMLFGVHVVTASSFRSWLSAQQASQARPVQ